MKEKIYIDIQRIETFTVIITISDTITELITG